MSVTNNRGNIYNYWIFIKKSPEVDMEACRMQRLPLRVLAQNKVHHFYYLKMISIQLLDNVSNILKVFRHLLVIRGRIPQ